MTDKGIGS